jgi:hypothetical protein
MGWNNYDLPGAEDHDIQELRDRLYAMVDLLWFLRLDKTASISDLCDGLADWSGLKHPKFVNDGQKRPDIRVPAVSMLDSTIVTRKACDQAADLLFHLADGLSWLQSDELNDDE